MVSFGFMGNSKMYALSSKRMAICSGSVMKSEVMLELLEFVAKLLAVGKPAADVEVWDGSGGRNREDTIEMLVSEGKIDGEVVLEVSRGVVEAVVEAVVLLLPVKVAA